MEIIVVSSALVAELPDEGCHRMMNGGCLVLQGSRVLLYYSCSYSHKRCGKRTEKSVLFFTITRAVSCKGQSSCPGWLGNGKQGNIATPLAVCHDLPANANTTCDVFGVISFIIKIRKFHGAGSRGDPETRVPLDEAAFRFHLGRRANGHIVSRPRQREQKSANK